MRLLKTKLSVIVLFAVMACSMRMQAGPVDRYGALQVQDGRLTGRHGCPVVLRGMSLGWHNWWPRFYNADAVQWLHRDWGCTVIRAAMGVDVRKGYLERPEWSLRKVKNVVEAAIDEGMYVIIDWHTHDIHLDQALEFFTRMAGEYGGYPHVIYEIFNEPDDETWPEVRAYSEALVRAIRAVDPDNIILVGSPHWCQDIHIAADTPLDGFDNIAYTVHFYAATHGEWLRERCDHAREKGLALFVSECGGMEANGDGDVDEVEWQNWMEWLETGQVSWVIWTVSDKNETCSVLRRRAGSRGGWKEKHLKPWGVQSRSLIRHYAHEDEPGGVTPAPE